MNTKNKIAVVFAGQGAQYPGMGKDFFDKYDYLKRMYEKASMITGYSLFDLCFTDNEKINQTKYTQPAVLMTSCAIYEVLKREYGINPIVMAGFSLGEYSALYAGGVFRFDRIMELVKYRAEDMDEEASKSSGKMAAILGLDKEILINICQEETQVSIANYNCPGQYVISGLADSVERVCEKAKAANAKRCVILNVSGAFHSLFMKRAAEKMHNRVCASDYQDSKVDIIMNCNAKVLDIENLPVLMKKQIESPVLFEDSIRALFGYQPDLIIEVGPGKVLSGLIRKTVPEANVISIDKICDLEKLNQEE